MPSITIQNLGNKTIQVEESVHTVLQTITAAGVDWMHACGAKGRCTTCMMKVVQGGDHLSEPSLAEERMQRQGRLPKGYRLACQCKATGDVLVRVPQQNKLPHQQYTD